MAKKHLLGPFDWFLLIGIVACNVVNSIATNSFDIIGTISSIAGIVCVVLCVNGSITNYLFGLINVTLYAYICYKSQLWGAAALNGLYYTPMQFIGFFQAFGRSIRISIENGLTDFLESLLQSFLLFTDAAVQLLVLSQFLHAALCILSETSQFLT